MAGIWLWGAIGWSTTAPLINRSDYRPLLYGEKLKRSTMSTLSAPPVVGTRAWCQMFAARSVLFGPSGM